MHFAFPAAYCKLVYHHNMIYPWMDPDPNVNFVQVVLTSTHQKTIGPENAHLKPDLGVLSHNEMTLTLNTHTPLLTS